MCRNMSRIFTYAHVSTGCSGKNFIWSFGCGLLMCKMGVSHPVIESIFLLVLFALDSVLLFKKYFVVYEKLFCLKIVGLWTNLMFWSQQSKDGKLELKVCIAGSTFEKPRKSWISRTMSITRVRSTAAAQIFRNQVCTKYNAGSNF